jgi:hypothetical protein
VGKEPFKLSVDANGNATLSSKLDILTFDGSHALEQIGLSLSALNIVFSNRDDSQHGCLTINGAQEDGEPAAMFLEYQRIGGTWLISNVYVYLQDKPKSFERALCPEEARREVMR